MVRKEGYFSITDACIKHWGANFLIMRPPPKKSLWSFSVQNGEVRRSVGDTEGMEENVPRLLPGWGTPGSSPGTNWGVSWWK